jgi:uncharacterized membrane protein YkoI
MRNLIASLLLVAAAGGLTAADGATPPLVPAPKPAPVAKPALTLEELPEAVRTALQKQADGAAIEKIKAEERGGEKVYSGRWTKDGVRNEVRLAADGRLLKLKAERKGKDASVSLDHLPEAVRKAVQARLADGKVAEVEQEDEKGKMVYSVEIARANDRLELEISADGVIMDEKVKTPEAKKEKGEKGEKDEKGEKPAGGVAP